MGKTIILRQNSKEIRQMIQDAGIVVCACASFKDSIWLNYSTNVSVNVHGVGYADDDQTTQQQAIQMFLHELENPVWCEDVETFIDEIKKAKQKQHQTHFEAF